MDTIEKSNLNRQFLFRPKDVSVSALGFFSLVIIRISLEDTPPDRTPIRLLIALPLATNRNLSPSVPLLLPS